MLGLPNAAIPVFLLRAADSIQPAAFGIPAFHAVRRLSFLVFCTDSPARNALAPRANCLFRWKEAWSIPSQLQQCRPRSKRLCPGNTESLAYRASTCRRARVPFAPHSLYPVPIVPLPSDKPPRRSRAVTWLAHEILPPLSAIEKRRRRLLPVPDELRAHLAADVTLHDILSPLPAFRAGRSNFPPSPDARAESQGKPPAKYRSIVLTASRWRGQGNTRYPDRSVVRSTPPANWRLPPPVAQFESAQFREQSYLALVRDAESPRPHNPEPAVCSPITDEQAPNPDRSPGHVSAVPQRS